MSDDKQTTEFRQRFVSQLQRTKEERNRLSAENERLQARVVELEAWQKDAYEYLCILLDHINGEREIPTDEWFIVENAQEFIESKIAALERSDDA